MSQESGKRTLVVILVVVLFLIGAGSLWYWGIYKPEQVAKERARLEQIAKQEAEQKRKEQAAQNKARYDQLISEADAAFDQENWEGALSLYTDASSILSNEQYPKDQLVLVNARLTEIAELEARKAAGIVETIVEPTGRFYLIISSSIDEDLARDYGRKLAQEGNSVQIVKHEVNGLSYYGVSIADYTTWDDAASATSSYSGFENGIWILKN